MKRNISVLKYLLLLTAFVSVRALSNSVEREISTDSLGRFMEYAVKIEEKIQGLHDKLKKFEELQENLGDLCENEQLTSTLNEKDNYIDKVYSTLNEKSCGEKLVSRLDAFMAQLDENTAAIKVLKTHLDTLNSSALHKVNARHQEETEIASVAINCIPFGDSMDIHEIEVTDFGQFKVRCDGQTAGPGWIVVQRRFDGSVDFYRNWTVYSEGFGDLEGEFFIGLEKLHRLTKSLPYELYIELVAFNGQTRFARYDSFLIGSEEERYMLKDLGTYSGNAGDALSYNLHDMFTTFDRDNDRWGSGNCGDWYKSGWWFNLYGNSNLNGLYFDTSVNNEESIWWYPWKGYEALESVKMMIRPKYSAL